MFDPVSLGLAALSAGGSLLSGFGAQQASKKQARLQAIADANAAQANAETLARVNAIREGIGNRLLDINYTVQAAEKAGINPISFLNAGGLSHMVDASKFLVPEYYLQQASQVPQQHSAMSAWGGALSAGSSMLSTMYRANQSFSLQQQKMNNAQDALFFGLSQGNQMRGVQSFGPSSGGNFYSDGGATVSGGLSGGSSKSKGDAFWPGYEHAPSPLWKAKEPESTNPFPPQWGWKIPAGFSNAEAWEDSMGEGVSIPYGIWKGVNTVMYNTLGYTVPDVYREAKGGYADLVTMTHKWLTAPNPKLEPIGFPSP